MADAGKHPAHLAVAALVYPDCELCQLFGALPRSAATPDGCGRGAAAFEKHAPPQLFEILFGRRANHDGFVDAFDFVAWMRQPRCKVAVARHE